MLPSSRCVATLLCSTCLCRPLPAGAPSGAVQPLTPVLAAATAAAAAIERLAAAQQQAEGGKGHGSCDRKRGRSRSRTRDYRRLRHRSRSRSRSRGRESDSRSPMLGASAPAPTAPPHADHAARPPHLAASVPEAEPLRRGAAAAPTQQRPGSAGAKGLHRSPHVSGLPGVPALVPGQPPAGAAATADLQLGQQPVFAAAAEQRLEQQAQQAEAELEGYDPGAWDWEGWLAGGAGEQQQQLSQQQQQRQLDDPATAVPDAAEQQAEPQQGSVAAASPSAALHREHRVAPAQRSTAEQGASPAAPAAVGGTGRRRSRGSRWSPERGGHKTRWVLKGGLPVAGVVAPACLPHMQNV